MKTLIQKSRWLAGCLAAALIATGCAHNHCYTKMEADGAPPAPAPKPTLNASKAGMTESTDGLMRLVKSMPAEANLGGEFVTDLVVIAQNCAANVVVHDSIPTGASYVRSEPAATVEENQLIWKLGNLDAGQVVKAKVWFKAEKEGKLESCAVVTADARVCGQTVVGKPVLAIDKTGPENAVLGTEVTYNITVRNTGTAAARNVVVTDQVPTGFSHSSGKNEITFDIGDLPPGQSKPVAVTFKANQRGKICNTVTATSSNAAKVSDDACTVILVPGLKVEKTGTKEQILGRNADYEIVVSNTGDTTLQNVVITDVAPAEMTIVAAPGASLEKNRATWTLATLAPGTKVTQTLKLTSKSAGTHCNSVSVACGTLTDSAKACTLWKGIPGVALEVNDDPDPIQIGESTVYTIKVTNQGFADLTNLKVAASFGSEVAPTSSPQGTVTGQKVNFSTVANLKGKQSTTYTVTIKGVKPGDSRNKITLICEELKSPVEEEESTTVY